MTNVFMQAPGPYLTFPLSSGSVYTSNQYALIIITNGSVADQTQLTEAGCVTLDPITSGVQGEIDAINAGIAVINGEIVLLNTAISNGGFRPLLGGPVRLANAAAIAAHTYNNNSAGVGATITFNSVGSQSVDGSATVLNDRVLYWDYTGAGGTSVEYGYYKVTTKGTGGAAEVWTRVVDGDTPTEIGNTFAYVLAGTANVGLQLMLPYAVGSIVIGTTPIGFVVASGTGATGNIQTQLNTVLGSIGPVVAPTTGTDTYAATCSPTALAYKAGAIYYVNFTNQNTTDSTLNLDAIGAIPVLQNDFTAYDPADLSGPSLLVYDTTYATPCFRTVTQHKSTSTRRMARLCAFLAQQSIASPSSKYSESAVTQTGSTITFGVSSPILCGYGFPFQILAGDAIIGEFVPGGSNGNNDAIALGFNVSAFTADYQNIGSTGSYLTWAKAGTLLFTKGDGSAGETFSGQLDPALLTWVNGDVLRIVIAQNAQGAGGQIMLYRNGDMVGYFSFTTTNCVGGYAWAGMLGVTSGFTVQTNFVRSVRIVPGSSRKVVANALAGSDGIGLTSSPFKTLQKCMQWTEYTADRIEYVLGGTRFDASLGIIPIMSYLKIRGAAATDPVQVRASHTLASGSSSFTKTGGYANIYQKAASFCGVASSKDGSCGFIGTVGNPAQAVGNPSARDQKGNPYTITHYVYTDAGNCTTATLAAKLTALDSTPGQFTNNTDTGVIYGNFIGSGATSVDPDTLTLEEVRYSYALLIPSSEGGYQRMEFEADYVDFGFAASVVVALSRIKIGLLNTTARGCLRGPGFSPDTCGGYMRGCRGYGNWTSGLVTQAGLFVVPGQPSNVLDFHVIDMDDCFMFGNLTNQGASSHINTRLNAKGGRYVANGNSGISGFCVDIKNADLIGNVGQGAFMLQLPAVDIQNKIAGCTIGDNGNTGVRVSSNSETTGSLLVEIEASRGFNNGTQHIWISGTAAHAAQTIAQGVLVVSGPAITGVTNSNGTNNMVTPTGYAT